MLQFILPLLVLTTLAGCASLRERLSTGRTTGTQRDIISPKLRDLTGPRKDTPSSLPEFATTNRSAAVAATGSTVRVKVPYRLRANDPVIIFLRDLPGAREQQLEDIVDDAGTVNLPFIGRVVAAGKTSSELEQEIEKKYIDEKIYLRLTVNVVTPQQFIFISGEVRVPNKYQLVAGMTLSQAISAAGGYTDYKDRKKVQLIRGGRVTLYNMEDIERNPSIDPALEPADQIVIPRSWY